MLPLWFSPECILTRATDNTRDSSSKTSQTRQLLCQYQNRPHQEESIAIISDVSQAWCSPCLKKKEGALDRRARSPAWHRAQPSGALRRPCSRSVHSRARRGSGTRHTYCHEKCVGQENPTLSVWHLLCVSETAAQTDSTCSAGCSVVLSAPHGRVGGLVGGRGSRGQGDFKFVNSESRNSSNQSFFQSQTIRPSLRTLSSNVGSQFGRLFQIYATPVDLLESLLQS